jgi:hypothetical protein
VSSQAIATTFDTKGFWSIQAGRLMSRNLRQSWLVPLLAGPLSQVALSPCCTDDVLVLCAPTATSVREVFLESTPVGRD